MKTTLDEAAEMLEAAADMARHGHAAGARRVVEHALVALLTIENERPISTIWRGEWDSSVGGKR